MTHILKHLDTDIKVIIDSHADLNTLANLRKEYRIEMAKYEIIGNFTKERGIMVLTRKSCGYKISNSRMVKDSNTLQFDLKSPSGVVYNVVAIYSPEKEGSTYWTELHDNMEKSILRQILYNVTLDPYLDRCN